MKTLLSLELFSVKLIIVIRTVFLFVISNWTVELIITQTVISGLWILLIYNPSFSIINPGSVYQNKLDGLHFPRGTIWWDYLNPSGLTYTLIFNPENTLRNTTTCFVFVFGSFVAHSSAHLDSAKSFQKRIKRCWYLTVSVRKLV